MKTKIMCKIRHYKRLVSSNSESPNTFSFEEKYEENKTNFKLRIFKYFSIVIIFFVIFIYLVTNFSVKSARSFTLEERILQQEQSFIPPGYLIWSPNCKIPDRNPFDEDAKLLFHKKNYTSCFGRRLTYISDDKDGNGVLNLNSSSFVGSLEKGEFITCCYSNITWPSNSNISESDIIISDCTKFNTSISLNNDEEFIVTKCKIKNGIKFDTFYHDAHTNLQITDKMKQRLETPNSNFKESPWKVLIIGIDSLSRVNLARAMPVTRKNLEENSWLDFKGYNKIDENTYPNMMAFLTGRNQSEARMKCENSKKNSIDDCDFVWKLYEKYGYVTSYGEDFVRMDTFKKPQHKGFKKPPTDHYMRPFFLAAEKGVYMDKEEIQCTGKTTSGEALYDYILSFVKKYKNHPYFGFFWTNTFSHNDVATPTRMDLKTAEFLTKLISSDAIDNTFIFFVSDHGIRSGVLRPTVTGYYEERLPAFYLHVPKTFKKIHPIKYQNIMINTVRLVSPYDFFVTLNEILSMSINTDVPIASSENCPKCQSLFQPVSRNRSCEDAGITPHWCTCRSLSSISKTDPIGIRAIQSTLDQIDNSLKSVNTNGSRICAKLNLQEVLDMHLIDSSGSEDYQDYLVLFSAYPEPTHMIFESTVRYYYQSDTFDVTTHSISRVTAYKGTANCVKSLKTFCSCL